MEDKKEPTILEMSSECRQIRSENAKKYDGLTQEEIVKKRMEEQERMIMLAKSFGIGTIMKEEDDE